MEGNGKLWRPGRKKRVTGERYVRLEVEGEVSMGEEREERGMIWNGERETMDKGNKDERR